MTITEIVALLEAKHQGARKDGLTNIARMIAMAEPTDEKQKELADRLTAEQVKQFIQDWRKDADAEITRANKTFEDGLRAKFDLVAKGSKKEEDVKPKDLDQDAISRMITEAVKAATQGVTAEVDALKSAAVANTRREQLSALFDKDIPESFKNSMISAFDAQKFENDDAFNAYVEKAKGDIASFKKELADMGLGSTALPIFGKANTDGVSAGIADYLKEKSEEGKNGLGGKQI